MFQQIRDRRAADHNMDAHILVTKGFLERQEVVSKFRVYKDVRESTFANEKTGHTIYFGSRQSEVMLRVYDKQLEQNQKAADGEMLEESCSPRRDAAYWYSCALPHHRNAGGGVICHYIIKWLDSGRHDN